ncbi:L-amino acid N-acyltransferase YncA [Cupriavidus sp. OV038]|uniref:GNAT family N-acetyltransferase n=1 Tax=unclassified Cupriavidus TaxID=2640874 RepID=UPI0008EE7B30|nr:MULTISPECIES: GNAT family N-acetyltransferase [unclassified Cupriavidus]SFD32695.1 L-amino acid N-acyltransferase YncA [Cupriavidus sp. OV038]SFQ00222.1 L-amino acid N-acyltransferase YncA [Cupriavidus sp. OV096]
MQDKPDTTTFVPFSVLLRDGREVLVREIAEDDRAGLLAAFDRLSADARYTRFMAAMQQLPEAMLEHATHPSPECELALVAVATKGKGPSIVGGVRYAAAPGNDTCEFAVTIVDDWHGLGLASRLLSTLIDTARRRGYRSMEGYVLSSNTAMRRLAHRLGFADVPCPDDTTLRVVTLAL